MAQAPRWYPPILNHLNVDHPDGLEKISRAEEGERGKPPLGPVRIDEILSDRFTLEFDSQAFSLSFLRGVATPEEVRQFFVSLVAESGKVVGEERSTRGSSSNFRGIAYCCFPTGASVDRTRKKSPGLSWGAEATTQFSDGRFPKEARPSRGEPLYFVFSREDLERREEYAESI